MINKKALEELQSIWESSQSQEQPKGIVKLPLDSIEIIPDLYQSRVEYDDSSGVVDIQHVAKLVAALKASHRYELDPIKVIKVGNRNILVDGHHRLKAYKNQKRKVIPAEWTSGSPKDALLVAGAENKKISLPLTALERSERAWKLVMLGPDLYSKRQIHQGTGASESTIASMRKKLRELQDAGEEIPDTWREASSNKDRDPEWLEKMIQEWTERITKTFGPPAQFNSGKLEVLRDALIQWSPKLAHQLALNLVESLGLTHEAEELVRIRSDELIEEMNSENVYGF